MPASRQRKLAYGRKRAAEIDSESNLESKSVSESAGPGSSGRARGSPGDRGGPRAVKVVCPGCGMAFPSSNALRRHINSHDKRSVACGFARLKQRLPVLWSGEQTQHKTRNTLISTSALLTMQGQEEIITMFLQEVGAEVDCLRGTR